MIGYMYTLSPDGTPIYLQYLWTSTDGDSTPVGYLLNNLVPNLQEENQGFSATVIEYPSIGLKVPALKHNGHPIEDYVESGSLKKENLQYIEFNDEVKRYISDHIAVLEENSVIDWDYFSSYRNPLGAVDSPTVGEKHRQKMLEQEKMKTPDETDLSAAEFGEVKTMESSPNPVSENESELSAELVQENVHGSSTEKTAIPLVFPVLLEEGTYAERERVRNGIPEVMPDVNSNENVAFTIVRDKIPSEFPKV